MEIGSGSGSGSGSGNRDYHQDQDDDLIIQTILGSYKDNRVCTICQEPVLVINMRSIAILKCTHVYHLDCIGSAYNFKNAMECPTCRHQESGEWLYAAGDRSTTRARDAVTRSFRLEPFEVQPVRVSNWNAYLGLGPMDPLLRGNQPNLQSSNPARGEATPVGSRQHNRAQQAPATDVVSNLFTGYNPPPQPSFPIRQSSMEHQNASSLYEAILDQQELVQVFPARENADHGTLELSLNIERNEAVQQDFPLTQSHTYLLGASSGSMMGGTLNWEYAPSLPMQQPSPVSAHGSAQARRRIMHQGNSVFAPHHFINRPRRAASEESETSSTQSNDFVQPASTTGGTSGNLAPGSPPAERYE